MDQKPCVVCLKPSASRCGKCKIVYYCNHEHQKSDWDFHKASCKQQSKKQLTKIETEFKDESCMDEKFLSDGLNQLGWQNLYAHFNAIMKYEKKQIPIIEVGSGNGYVLAKLAQRYEKVIGVDNYACESYGGGVSDCNGRKPAFATIDDYLKNEKKQGEKTENATIDDYLKNEKKQGDKTEKTEKMKKIEQNSEENSNAILFLNWPSPNYSDYDYDSFVKMKPAWCVIVFDTAGTAGGHKMMSMLTKIGLELEHCMIQNSLPSVRFTNEANYKVVATTTRYGKNPFEKLCYKIVVLSRVCDQLEVDAPKVVKGEFQVHLPTEIPLSAFNPDTLKKLAKNTGIDVATCLQLMSGLAGAKIVKG